MVLQKSKRSQADVALSFTKHVFDYQEKNLIFSPLSIQAALSIMAAGSEGRTLDELLSFLRFDSVDHLTAFFSQVVSAVFSDAAASHHLSFANGIWADDSVSLSHPFKQLAATNYKATLASLDFRTKDGDQVVREVNSWIEKETNGLISQFLSPGKVTDKTNLIFANALLFKGEWKHKFYENATQSQFYLLNGTSVVVPFLESHRKTQYIKAFDGFKILQLPYKQGRDRKRRFSMCFFLPDANDGLSALIEKLSSESGFLEGKLPRQKVPVLSFMIPSFRISFTFEASNVLKEVGVVSPFSRSDANFGKMVESNFPFDNLCVENIFHKAFIEVSEKGTEATAATVSGMRPIPLGVHQNIGINFVADHPFLFLIREDFTGTILFVGQVLNPLDGAAPVKRKVLTYRNPQNGCLTFAGNFAEV